MFRRGITACDECTKNCITMHHLEQHGPSSTVSRFFKIMHRNDYSEVLYLPPKFAQDVRDLVGQKTQIEDSSGQKWTVQFSYVDGALAFQDGWRKFVEDHQLERGEMLMFNYIKNGHFVVQIYGLSACEITEFNRGHKRPNKRSRSDQGTTFQDEPQQIRNKQFPLTSKNMEDPSCMLNRDSGQYRVEDREFLFDLSNFEMEKNSSIAEKSETSLDRNIMHVETQIREQIEVMRNDIQMSMPLTDQKNNHLRGILTDAFQTKPSGNSDPSKDMPDDVSKFQAGELENNSLCGIVGDALQDQPSGNSDSRKGMLDDASKFQASEMEIDRLCGIFSGALQNKPSGNSDFRKGMPDDVIKFRTGGGLQNKPSGNSDFRKGMPDDAIKFQTGGTNNYQSRGFLSYAFLAKPSSNSDSGKDIFNDVSKSQACETIVSPPCVARDAKSPYICSSLLAESDCSLNSKLGDTSVTGSMLKDPFGKPAATFKKELVELEKEVYGFPQVSSEDAGITSILGMKCGQISSSILKTEPNMANYFVPAVATSPLSAEVTSLDFLELPICMPSIQGKRERGRDKVVYLKDSTTRLWPVLYPGKLCVKAFADGWETFCKGNSIRVGDVCRLRVEKYMPCVFKVDIIRKAGQSS